ncbi:alanine--tRNA ligase [Candidatus Cerribacteria bacterium 'Amazon FNV 2010 28 9']|uniref:Alanine--tRNA ligase n=1 Tax=Candidatus Cerribacteria bacterium 'Amazon FNV 2010 28 9' TaxID=2081795 RepID=A0A317JNG6_9BACT|nr:MAG: alanine--tRNA ligase [Candidatus Cerribacteria bacterium 'Amazon FNV 2010 28 9']
MTGNDLRTKYLKFFESKQHTIIPSSPLVPENDPSTLFTSSGMQPLVPYLLGQPHPQGTRLVDSQKCFRSQDIEEVGDNRHDTFFEMLGNWSLGDYFKKEQLTWVFEFLTKELQLNPGRLFVTVFAGNESVPRDEESIEIWKGLFASVGMDASVVDNCEKNGMSNGRIFTYSEKKNWWSRSGVPAVMPAGEPGGPDSEMFFDCGEELHLHENSPFKNLPCHVNCDCGRFFEIGNSVFMQYKKGEDGVLHELEHKNVDFGGGIERLLAAVNDTHDMFKIDVFWPIIQKLESFCDKKYGESEQVNKSFQIVADHIRAAVMLAADGVVPSNKAQGYFSRRLVRRAIRYAQMIGIEGNLFDELVDVVANMYEEPYPSVKRQAESVKEILKTEEQKFKKTLNKGLKEIEKIESLNGEIAFKLFETYGFPLELTQEIAIERGQVVDKTQFEAEFVKHRELSRTASVGMFKGGLADHSEVTTKYHTATHLLQAALRKVLGTHVGQKGSNITVERMRFDFSHPQALTKDEIQQVENQINDWIAQNLPVTVATMSKEDALKSGAIAFFIEKYPETVTVYTIGKDPVTDWISKELCGGPHVTHTGEIGKVEITKEQAVSAGVRRIYVELEK